MTQRLIDPEEFKDVIDSIGDGVRFDGIYHGRGMFVGLGVVLDSASDSDIMKIAIALAHNNMEEIASGFDHSDSMGYGRVIAWNRRRFDWAKAEELERVRPQWQEEF